MNAIVKTRKFIKQEQQAMISSQDIAHVQHLIQSGQLDEAHTELSRLLRGNPGCGDAWVIAAQFTSEPQQCIAFLKKAFETSSDTALTAWAFRNLGDLQPEGSVHRLSPPPIESLIVLSDARVPLDDLLAQVTSTNLTSPAEGAPPPLHTSDGTPLLSPLIIDEPSPEKPGLPFSIKRLGVMIMLAGGLTFVASVFSEPVLSFFFYTGSSPLFCCLLPSLLLGTSTLVVGFFVDKKH